MSPSRSKYGWVEYKVDSHTENITPSRSKYGWDVYKVCM